MNTIKFDNKKYHGLYVRLKIFHYNNYESTIFLFDSMRRFLVNNNSLLTDYIKFINEKYKGIR